ncbi:MAG TPA: amidohydrolase [Candidatus Eisenbacteria bacterium]|nr:amidohydrolase [Candidatus Eisenbacteria bacterium]
MIRRAAEPDLVLIGATLLDASRAPARPGPGGRRSSGAEAVWIRGDRIVAVGAAGAIRAKAGRAARRIDLGGGTLTPGFTDAHIHLVTWNRALGEPSLEDQTPEAIERAVGARLETAPREDWLLLRGWVPREWPGERRDRALLDRIASDRPLVLHAVDGHSVWANRVALERAGIDRHTPDPRGGIVERSASGELTGALIEEALRLLTSRIVRTAPVRDELTQAVARARSLGITSAHDFDRSATWRAAAELAREGRLDFRLLLSVPVAALGAAEDLGLATGMGGDRLRVGAVKMFADGTLGSSTALLEEPYEGTANRGIEVLSADDMASACARAAQAGLGVAIHAIGDAAVRNALDAIERTLRAGALFPLPPRIEHIQLSRVEDWPRFRKLGVLASVQPVHLLTDRAIAPRLWGSRTPRSYAWKSLAAAGARLVFGSDAPFDRAGPLRAIQAAVLRRDGADSEDRVFHQEQRIPLGRALRAHLEDPHLAAGWTLPLGKLEAGYGADVVHFDHDLARTPLEEWHRARVRSVWIGGRRIAGASGRS